MRAIVCTDYEGTLRKLIWVTENKSGISAGIYERDTDPHATYHADGTYHHKITHRGRTVTAFAPEQKPPLSAISTQAHLLGTAASYGADTMQRLPEFKADGRANAVVVLSQSAFRGINCAALNSYIINRNHEEAFLSNAYASYENGSFMLISVNVFSLHHFRDHKVGVIVYRGRGIVEQHS